MKSDTWKDYFELVGIAAIVVSLVFVGYQVRQSTAVARRHAYINFSSQFFELISNAALDERLVSALRERVDYISYRHVIFNHRTFSRHSTLVLGD
jgi:hypothetical protein